jgi:hypothetical protein
MRIDAQDLEETLKIDKALDRRRLCTALDKLRRRYHSTNARRHDAGLKGSSKASQKALDGYIDALDRDRVRCVARLKVAFDAQAPSKENQDENDRALDSEQLHRAFKSLRRDLNAPHVREWFDDLKEDSTLKFLEFVDAYVALFASEDPDLKLSHGAAKALGDRVKVLASGHVQLSKEKAPEKSKPKKTEIADAVKKTKKRSSSASSSSDDDDDGKVWKPKGDAQAAARAADETLGSVRRLAELKQKFDRFAVDDLLTGAEALQALTELGCTIPRRAAAAYFRERGAQGGPSRDVSFFEFLRAFAALELEDEPLSRGRSRSRSSGSDSSRERLDRKVNKAARRTRDKRVEAAKETARRSRCVSCVLFPPFLHPSEPPSGPRREKRSPRCHRRAGAPSAAPETTARRHGRGRGLLKKGGAASGGATPSRPGPTARTTTRAPRCPRSTTTARLMI